MAGQMRIIAWPQTMHQRFNKHRTNLVAENNGKNCKKNYIQAFDPEIVNQEGCKENIKRYPIWCKPGKRHQQIKERIRNPTVNILEYALIPCEELIHLGILKVEYG